MALEDGGTLMNGINVLKKETLQSPFPFLTCKDAVKRQWLWTRKFVSASTQPCWRFDFGLPASPAVRHKFLLLISYTVVVFCNGLRQYPFTKKKKKKKKKAQMHLNHLSCISLSSYFPTRDYLYIVATVTHTQTCLYYFKTQLQVTSLVVQWLRL